MNTDDDVINCCEHDSLSSCPCQFAFLFFISLISTIATEVMPDIEFAFIPHHQYHTGVEDRRVGTANNTYEQSQCEWANSGAAKQSKRSQGKDYSQRRI